VLDPAARGRRLGRAVLCGLLLTMAVCLPPLHPLPVDLCLLHRLTGLRCLTCGLTRSICLLAHGRWRESLAMHPAGVLVATAILVNGVLDAAESVLGRRLPRGLPFDRAGRP
jgi:Protein of unknown function (DUF2752)